MSQQQQDNSLDVLWIVGSLIAVYLLISFFWGDELLAIHLFIRSLWLKVYTVVWPLAWNDQNLKAAQMLLKTHQAAEWKPEQVAQLSKDLRFFMFLVLGIPLGLMLKKVGYANPGQRFRRKMGVKELIQAQSSEWPWVLPSLKIDLVATPIDKGPWAMSRTPLDFARHYRLLSGQQIDQERTDKLFASQLGKLWEGPDRLRPHQKALFACFISQMCRDKDGSDGAREHLRQLSLGMVSGKPDFAFVDRKIKQHYDDPRVQAVVSKHAYVSTVMCAVLKEARRNGVMPCAFFLWMRPLDRSLWYSLQSLGRRAYFPEGSATHSHYLAEIVAGHAIVRPYVVNARKALADGLSEIRFD